MSSSLFDDIYASLTSNVMFACWKSKQRTMKLHNYNYVRNPPWF